METYLKNHIIASIIVGVIFSFSFEYIDMCTNSFYNVFWAFVLSFAFVFGIYCDKYINSK